MPAYDPLDIAYVGTIMLEAAGLPLSAAQRERNRLMVGVRVGTSDVSSAAKSWPSIAAS